jgi:sugar O-acyltransferase (sialic acid O-acetyltransferase NeuD family)
VVETSGKKQVVIFGVGQFAQVAYVYLTEDSPYSVAGFTVHERYCPEGQVMGCDVVAFEQLENAFPPDAFAMFVAIGFSKVNQARADVYAECKARGYQLITYVNSKAARWGYTSIGDNCFIFEQNVIQPFVTIGNDVILWSGNHIGHHATIEDHCFVASHAVISGGVRIGHHSFVGVNATFRDGISVGSKCVIGAGALILHDLPDRSVCSASGTEPSKVTSDRLRGF